MTACQPRQDTLFVRLDASETGITFENKIQSATTDNILEYDYFYMGAGVAAADFDNDGYTDLYFSGNQTSGRLYRNKGNQKNQTFRFDDVTAQAGLQTSDWCTGVAVADVNNDSWPDLYVCHAGLKNTANQLFINQGKQPDGKLRFKEQGRVAGVDFKGYSTHAAFLDYDHDGDADLYLLNHYHEKINPNYPRTKTIDGSSPSNDRLFRNDGTGHFTDVTVQAGITTEGFGLGVAVSDINADGWPDVYVANDFAYDDLLYINNQNGTFSERAKDYLRHTSRFSMGCDVADFNNDFYPDILTVDMMPEDNKRQKLMGIGTTNDLFNFSLMQGYRPQYARNMLQLNNGDGSFSEIGQLAGVYKTDWSWSALLADLDNDGWKDIFITNGIPRDITNNDFTAFRDAESQMGDMSYSQVRERLLHNVDELEPVDKPNVVFRNTGDGFTFQDVSQAWGLNTRGFSNGAVYADLDNDGDLDVATNNLNAPPFIYRNTANEKESAHYLRVKLNGTQTLGTKIRVVCGKQQQFAEYSPYRGFQSTQEPFVHFGLGAATRVDTVDIIWPDGRFQRLLQQKANQTLAIQPDPKSSQSADYSFGRKAVHQPLFLSHSSAEGISYRHTEHQYEDFNNEPLLPHRFSQNGPFLAVGDVNGDRRDDFWVGGPALIAGELFIQQANGQFQSRKMPDEGFEDQQGLFFDADGDKDLDLYIVSGGNEYNPLTAAYQDRLYINDGTGNFSRRKEALPTEYASGQCVKAADFDRDGDLDLFVGGRVVPNQYPRSPESFLLQNDGKGHFTNVTAALAEPLQYAGMVTSVAWSDVDSDGWPDLIVVGEMMPVLVFGNEKGRFRKRYESVQKGLWTCIQSADFDGDGDADFVVGNLGLNNKYGVSQSEPVSVYGISTSTGVQPVLSYYVHGREYPVAGRDLLVSKFPGLKKKFLTYGAFAEAGFEDLFPAEEVELKLSANYLASVYLENKGNISFGLHPLPVQAQFAPLNDCWLGDVNQDKHLDILAIGNSFSPEFMTGRYDASCGLVLLGNGRGQFRALTPNQSGIHLKGDMKSLIPLQMGNQSRWLIGTNDASVQQLTLTGTALLPK